MLVWTRTAQGSRGAPLVCGRALALAMRMAAATIPEGAVSTSTYVDDPISTFIGEQQGRSLSIGKLVGSILAMGFDLVFAKAHDSMTDAAITWTSAVFELMEDELGIKVTVNADVFSIRWQRYR